MDLLNSLYSTDNIEKQMGDCKDAGPDLNLHQNFEQKASSYMFSMFWSYGFSLERHTKQTFSCKFLNVYLSPYYYSTAYNGTIMPEIEWCGTIIDFFTSFTVFLLFKKQNSLND